MSGVRGELQDRGQGAVQRHVGLASLITRQHFDPVDQATQVIHGLRACGLIGQQGFYLLHLAAVKLAKVWMDLERGRRMDLTHAAFEIALAGLELCQLLPNDPRIPIAIKDEGERPFNATVDLVELLALRIDILMPTATQALHFHPKARGELGDQVVPPKEDVLQPRQDPGLKLCGADADGAGAGAALPARRAGVAFAIDDGHGTPAPATADQTGEKALLRLSFVAGL